MATYSTAMYDTSLERGFIYLLLWHIASADSLIKTSTTDVCVTLPPNFKQVLRNPDLSGQKHT